VGARPISSGSSTPTFYAYSALLFLGRAIGDRYGHARLLVVSLGLSQLPRQDDGSALSLRGLLVIQGERRDRREFERPRLRPRRRPLPLA